MARVPADQLLQAPAVQTQASWKGRERQEFSLGLESSGNPRGGTARGHAWLSLRKRWIDSQLCHASPRQVSSSCKRHRGQPGSPIGHNAAALAPGKLPFFHSLPAPVSCRGCWNLQGAGKEGRSRGFWNKEKRSRGKLHRRKQERGSDGQGASQDCLAGEPRKGEATSPYLLKARVGTLSFCNFPTPPYCIGLCFPCSQQG